MATGAHERPLVFSGNDLPGVMLAGAARMFANRYGSLPGRRVVITTNNDDAYRTAIALQKLGVMVRAIADIRPNPKGALVKAVKESGVEVLTGHAVTVAAGKLRVGRVEISPVNEDASEVTGEPLHRDCDLLLMSGGLSPAVHLHSQARGKLKWDETNLCFRPSTTHEREQSVGAANGTFDVARYG